MEYNYSCLVTDCIHLSYPFKLIIGFLLLRDTFLLFHLCYQLKKHIFRRAVNLLQVGVQLARKQHPDIDAVAVLLQIAFQL